MRKINIFSILLITISFMLPSTVNAQTIEKKTLNECITTSLTIDETTVQSGTQVQVTLNYESVTPVCSTQELAGQQITVDLSGLVESGSDISTSFDTSHFTVEIANDGKATLTFKDLSHENETLTGFGGNVIFTINVKEVIGEETITITDSEGNTVDVNVEGSNNSNSNKVSDSDYVEVGSIINYTVLINGNHNSVEKFKAIDTASAGLEYIPGSFWAEEDKTWINADNVFQAKINDEGNGEVENLIPFNKAYLLHYQMKVSDRYELYSNKVDLTYDSKEEHISDDVHYDLDGGSWVNYDNARIDLYKTDSVGKELEGVEFTIYDQSKNVVEILTTDESGYAQSQKLPLGTYIVKETKALPGYQISSTEYPVTLNGQEDIVTVNEGNPIINELCEGQLDLKKIDENGKPLSGAEFTIYDQDNNKIDVLTTDNNGYAKSQKLPLGTYTVKETKAPTNYQINNKEYKVELINSGEIVHVNNGTSIINYLSKGQLDLTKVDEDGKVLSGAEFTIYDQLGNMIETLITNESGYAKSQELPLGQYVVKETKAPDGYKLDDKEYSVNIIKSGETVHVNDGKGIVNKKLTPWTEIKPSKPETPWTEIKPSKPENEKETIKKTSISAYKYIIYIFIATISVIALYIFKKMIVKNS